MYSGCYKLRFSSRKEGHWLVRYLRLIVMKVRKAPKEAIKVSEVTASLGTMSCPANLLYWGWWSFFHHDHETLMRCHFPFHCSVETLWSKAQITLRIRLMTQRFTFQALIPLVKTWPTFHFIWLQNDIFIIGIFTNFHRICHLYCCPFRIQKRRNSKRVSHRVMHQTHFPKVIWQRGCVTNRFGVYATLHLDLLSYCFKNSKLQFQTPCESGRCGKTSTFNDDDMCPCLLCNARPKREL